MKEWWEHSTCSSWPDPSLWVGADKRHHTLRQEGRAKAICWEVCPVRKECLLESIGSTSKVIAGGLNHTERKALLEEHGGDQFSAVLASQRQESTRAAS